MGSEEGMPAETVAPPGGGLRKEQVVGGGDGAAGKGAESPRKFASLQPIKFTFTGSSSHLRTMLPKSSSRPLPALRPNNAT